MSTYEIRQRILYNTDFSKSPQQRDPRYWYDQANKQNEIANSDLIAPDKRLAALRSAGDYTSYGDKILDEIASPIYQRQKQQIMARDAGIANVNNTRLSVNNTYDARQLAEADLDKQIELMEKFRPGLYSGPIANIRNAFQSLGFDIGGAKTPQDAYYAFQKYAMKNVFDQAQRIGGRLLVTELAGLQKSSQSPDQPRGANAIILARAMAAMKREDDYRDEFNKWDKQNPYATSKQDFDNQFSKDHKLKTYVDDTMKDIAIPREEVRNTNDLIPGQLYLVTNKGKTESRRWDGNRFQPYKQR